MTEKIRIYRIIEYVGDWQWVQETIRESEIKREWWSPPSKRGKIRAMTLGQFAEPVTLGKKK